MAIVRINARVEGRVQGVFFRDCTRQEAERHCLHGWVRNQADGSVETEFQGEEAEVAAMVQWLHQGSPLSRVSRVVTKSCPGLATESGFRVKY